MRESEYVIGDVVFFDPPANRRDATRGRYVGVIFDKRYTTEGSAEYHVMWGHKGEARKASAYSDSEHFVLIGHIPDIKSEFPIVEVKQ